jgi:pimeloyl-ACP methyl ester carboxylesterase
MPYANFDSDGIEIAYRDEGEGDPILLIHGFASNHGINWVGPGWFDTLGEAGYRVIALDNRGHGQSEKLYDPALYPRALWPAMRRRLLDHLGIEQAAVMGYSMGARISAFLSMDAPERVSKVVFGGLGINMVRGIGGAEIIAEALRAPTLLRSSIRWAGRFAHLPSKQAPTARRWRPAFWPRATRSPKGMCAALPSRRWWRWHP